jgi:hypothetical protein
MRNIRQVNPHLIDKDLKTKQISHKKIEKNNVHETTYRYIILCKPNLGI